MSMEAVEATLDRTPEYMQRLLLTRDQVAAILGIEPSSVDYLHRTGALRAVRVGKCNRWKPATVQQYVDALKPDNDDGGD